MTFKTFTEQALRTESKIEKAVANRALFAHALNLAIASTAIMDLLKKNIFYDKAITAQDISPAIRQAHESASFLLYSEAPLKDENIGEIEENLNPRLVHGIIGKYTESGELLQALALVLNGKEVDTVNIGEEIGDDQWYTALLCDELGLDIEAIQTAIIEKLQARYPDKFTSEGAIERDLDTEREVLEGHLATTETPAQEATV